MWAGWCGLDDVDWMVWAGWCGMDELGWMR